MELEADETKFTYDLTRDLESHLEEETKTTKDVTTNISSEEEGERSQFIIKRSTRSQVIIKEKRKLVAKARTSKEITKEAIEPKVVDVESFGEKQKVYVRRSSLKSKTTPVENVDKEKEVTIEEAPTNDLI